MTTREIRIDRGRTLADQAETGHNRWHPDIPPILECGPGDEVILETRDALDGQLTADTTLAQVGQADLGVVHPLTGPVYVAGARPGDLLEVEILEVAPEPFGFTAQLPGFGFLADVFTEPYLIRWRLENGSATSEDLPGVRVPGAPFMGTIGLTPGHELMRRTRDREQAALDAGGVVLPPDPAGAVPATEAIAREALRTIPPREQGGNVDIKHLVAGTKLFLPVDTPGALFSAGDAHFAQGDSEACGTPSRWRPRCGCASPFTPAPRRRGGYVGRGSPVRAAPRPRRPPSPRATSPPPGCRSPRTARTVPAT